MSKNDIQQRLAALRDRMKAHDIAATIIPQTDPHQSEYLADHWQVRRWLSGFTGSAGTLVVTPTEALLWVDSRYFLQAADQLDGTDIKMMKIAIPGYPTIYEYIAANLKPGQTVGIDGMLFSSSEYNKLLAEISPKGIKTDTSFDPVQGLWTDRPELPDSPVILHDTLYAGQSAADKLEILRRWLRDKNADAMLVSALDELAWTLNIRSRDVRCNPVATGYLLINAAGGGILFINEAKIAPEVALYLQSLGIEVKPYHNLAEYLPKSGHPVVAVDPSTTSARILDILGDRALAIQSPIPMAKACKNEVQAQGFRNAMRRDGVALVGAIMELEKRVKGGERVTELTVSEILRRHRSQQNLFFDESFETIAGYGPHGAIVHYSATPETDSPIGTDNLLLIDSGAQYLDGTTDITRTIIIGEPSPDQRRDFTLVLKGNIALALAVFPTDTRGTQLDVLAHMPLWRNGYNYLHGTGHGVGHFLNVHEGPHSIRTNENPNALHAGMTVTDEPGLYLEGRYGIRCENTLLVIPAMTTEAGDFLKFESLTLFPFQRQLIDPSLLSVEELAWINDYHRRVYDSLSPSLDTEACLWLATATAPIIK